VVKWFVFFQLLSWVILEIHQVIFAAVSAPVSCVPKTGWQEVIPKPEPLMDQLLESVRKMEYIREAWNRG
jgi:hypothetical protein